jgi:hypothetical protein
MDMKFVEVFTEKQERIVDVDLLGCNTMCTDRYIPTFWRNILPPSSGLKS